DDRIVGCRLTNGSRPRNKTCEQFFSRYLSPAAIEFQNASRLSTRIVATPILSSVWRLGVNQGTPHKCRILRRPKPEALLVPSRVVLEFGDAISGISRVSGQAARSIG